MYKVFLVDDEPYVTEGLSLMIDWVKYDCEIAAYCSNGKEALDKMQEIKPDIIITDVRMPLVSGLELVEKVHEIDSSIKCILLTGYDEFKYAAKAIRHGVRHYLLKPIDVDEIHEALEDVCSSLKKRGTQGEDNPLFKELSAILASSLDLGDSSILEPYREHLDKFRLWHYVQVRGVISVVSGVNMFLDKLTLAATENKKAFLLHSMHNSIELAIGVYEDSEKEIREILEPIIQDCEPSIYMVVGKGVEDADRLSESYMSAALIPTAGPAASDDRFIFSDSEGEPAVIDLEIAGILDEIFSYVETIDFEKGREMILETYRRANSMWYKNFYSCFIYRIAKAIVEYGGDSDSFFTSCKGVYQGNDVNVMQESTIELYDALQKFLIDLNKSRSNAILDRIEMYLKQHYKEEIFIKELAKQFYCNPVYIGNAFNKKYDISIKDYIHRLRISESLRLMEETDMTLSDIAYEIGYNNYNNFYAHFEQIMGIKPIDYRKNK